MEFKLSPDFARQLDDLLSRKQDVLLDIVRDVVETQYCTTHGRFAEMSNVKGEATSTTNAELTFTTCCDDLKAKIQAAIAERQQEQEHHG